MRYLTSTGLIAAYWSHQPVSVYQQALLLDYGGQIERITELSITINGAKYLRSTCAFSLR
ncbi:MAG: hypothetical protein K6T85_12375 [Gorillibacterium sp.]|nr:hypothetical protein [Gorillibacterium sp.]